jgi:VanZ family protein
MPTTRRLILWLPVVVLMAAIFAVSSMSSPPAPPGVSDKSLHWATYAGLALLTLRALADGAWAGVGGRTVLGAWVIATLYGATDEWHQRFTPGRHADWYDLAADASGAAAAVAAVWAWSIIRRSRGAHARPRDTHDL